MKPINCIVVAIVPLLAGRFVVSESQQQQQSTAVVAGPTPQMRSHVILSAGDDSVFHAMCFLTGVFSGGEEGQVLVGDHHRVVSIASYVTVGEEWQPSLCHAVMTVNADGKEAVRMVAGYEAGGRRSFEILVSPANGATWRSVDDAKDLSFATQSM